MSRPLPADAPAEFVAAVAAVRGARVRQEVVLDEVPAPARLAPWAFAVAGEVSATDDASAGRFVVLHDPAGQEGWSGPWRVVVLARANVENDLAGDPLLLGVAWSWVLECLATHGVEPDALGGTVTRVSSQGFGELSVHPSTVEVQVRASFSPPVAAMGAAFAAWADLLCTVGGLPPLPEGVLRFPAPE